MDGRKGSEAQAEAAAEAAAEHAKTSGAPGEVATNTRATNEAKASTGEPVKATESLKADSLETPAGATSQNGTLVKKDGPPSASDRAAAARSRRLMKELKDIQQVQSQSDPPFTVELVNDNISEWHVKLRRIDPQSELAADMRNLNIPHILLHLTFPDRFPFAPPFMRVVEPRVVSGHVFDGAICMELLTPDGWSMAYTVESVVMQFAATVAKAGGRVYEASERYSREEAEASFLSIVEAHKHGWYTPNLSEG